ncbi:MAG TPA: FIVAR domain-containing protein, partial [Candidatus Anaerofilum excrementigallinarum]|nr:FIVAR domain-containing protein [Candidatus Anaerofilum excrementigallinarum]
TRTDAENYSEDVMSPYRERTVTLNGKVILKGHVSRSDNNQKGDETYLIPWYWSATGEDLAADQQKLYHWNTQGGTTEWELPNGWENLENVVMYTLSDQGKSNETVVPVVNGKVTLTAEAEVPYVVYKGEQGQIDIGGWQGNHLYDTGFNSYSLEASKWTVNAGSPTIDNTVTTNPMMILAGGDSVTHTITDLVPGESYALYIGVDNRSKANAHMTVTSVNGSVLASNYTGLSFVNNYVSSDPHSNNIPTEEGAGSHFQNMYVFFVADAETATLTLSRDAGTGLTYFDNMRCLASEGDPYTYDENGEVSAYFQDFENVVQGMYPFVVGPVEGVTDNRSHLSELHAPYTQSGWDVKKGDDVLEGNWSLKSNGLVQRNSILYQTIPQNFRFEPGCTYKVSFDYQIGSEGTYAVVVGNEGNYDASKAEPLHYLADENGEFITQTYETTITGEANGQTWFGLMSTNVKPDTQGTSGAAATFGDYSNLMIDNVRIERVDDTETITKDQLNRLIDSVKDYTFATANCNADEWQAFETALAAAKVVAAADDAAEQEIKSAYLDLKAAKDAVDNSTGLPANDDRADLDRTQMTAEAGNPELGEGADNLLDNNPNTIYHTNWSGASGKPIATMDDFWIEITLNNPETVNGLRYLPRNSGANGKMTAGTIEVQVEGNDQWIPVKAKGGEGNAFTFSTSGWSKANFEPVENVVKVRLVATATIGDTANTFFSASEIRLTTLFEQDAPAMDTTGLETAINLAKVLNKDRYTADSWKAVETALANAEKVLADENATADQVAAATRELNNAINALVMPVDTKQVEELLAMYNNLDRESLVGDWAAVEAAAAKLQDIMDDENATQTQANAVIREFLEAVNQLQFTDVKRVKEAIASAEDVLNSVSSDAFTDESWQAAQDALAALKALLEQEVITVDEADKAIADLQNAIKNLVPSNAKETLDATIAAAQALEPEEYTTSSWKAVEDALTAALAVQADAKATTEDYVKAVANMTAAMSELTKRGDTAALAKFVEQAKALQEANYTAESWKAFAQALADAEKLLANAADASQNQLDTAYTALLSAQTALVRVTDKGELNGTLAEADKLNKNDYTADSWDAMVKAKEAAAKVAADPNATQAEVDAARSALLKAIQALVKVVAPVPNPSTPSGGSSSSTASPTTGDTFPVAAVAGLLAVSAGAAVVLGKKRKENE